MKKYLLLFPPVWGPVAPYLAVPTLLGQLKKEGFNTEAIDLNIEFYNDVLSKSYLEKSINNLKKIQIETAIEAEKYDITNKKTEDYPIEIQEIILKDKAIKEYLAKKSNLLKTIPKLVEKAVSNIKNPKEFYNPESFKSSAKIIFLALEIASLPYSPAKTYFNKSINPLFKATYDNIKHNVFSKSTNIFIDFYEKWLPKIQKKKPDYIGISIGTRDQVIPALTLASLLKKHTNAHINIGGNHFSRTIDSFYNFPEFFDLFADSISVYEGEKPIVELAKYIDNQIPIEDVPNLIYRKNGEIIKNKNATPLPLDEIPTPCFEGYDFSKYMAPDIVLPIQTTRGCYWSKCTFCDIPHGKKYSEKNLDALINDLKFYKKKYGINKFEITDEAVNPVYLEKIAEKIIENDLNINYFCAARTESEFTKELLEKARKSGLRIIFWGLESGSKRVLEFMNKGVDIDARLRILQDSSNADIWNHGFTFFGLPTETIDEAKETIDMLYKNSNIINSYATLDFHLSKHSRICKDPEKYGIISINKNQEEFGTTLDFEAKGMSREEMNDINQLQHECFTKTHGSSLWRWFYWEYIMLYVCRHGADWVKNYKFDNSKNKK